MYLVTEASEILMSNFIRSLWILGAPQIGFSAADGSNQIADLFGHLRPSSLPVPNLESPIPTKSLTIPADDGFRHDDD